MSLTTPEGATNWADPATHNQDMFKAVDVHLDDDGQVIVRMNLVSEVRFPPGMLESSVLDIGTMVGNCLNLDLKMDLLPLVQYKVDALLSRN